nr:MAG TPA: hypothetical protein [Caudoviricetes sp.]
MRFKAFLFLRHILLCLENSHFKHKKRGKPKLTYLSLF